MIYEKQCSCNLRYIGKPKRNNEVRWNKYEDPAGKSKSAKHLIENAFHKFAWKVLPAAPSQFHKKENSGILLYYTIVTRNR